MKRLTLKTLKKAKRQYFALLLIGILAFLSCQSNAIAAKKETYETIKVIKTIKGSCGWSNSNDISDVMISFRYEKTGVIQRVYDHNALKLICKYNDEKMTRSIVKDFNSNGIKNNWKYDRKNRLKWKNNFKYLYDASGRLKKIKSSNDYKSYYYNDSNQISDVNTHSLYSTNDRISYVYDEHGNIVNQIRYGRSGAFVSAKSVFYYNEEGYPTRYEYSFYDSDSDIPPYEEIWQIENSNIEYEQIKIPKRYKKVVQQQQWEIVNSFFTEDLFYDTLTPYINM